jgi:hypothetical protein
MDVWLPAEQPCCLLYGMASSGVPVINVGLSTMSYVCCGWLPFSGLSLSVAVLLLHATLYAQLFEAGCYECRLVCY